MLIPYAVDVPQDHKPVVNWFLISSIVSAFGLGIAAVFTGHIYDPENLSNWVLTGWDIQGLFGHMWVHAGPIHLIGNMIFLWVFGNAVCGKVGNLMYLPLYLAFGLFAAAAHLIFDGNPAVGASGAINGVVGMYLVFYPLNDISCLWIFNIVYIRTFSISSYWMILFWLAFDILGAVLGFSGTAYFAHLGGFAVGMALAFLLLIFGIIKMNEDERSILCIIREHRQNRLEDRLAQQARQAVMKAKQEEEEQERALRVAALKEQAAVEKPTHAARRSETIRFTCSCGQRIKVPRSYAGRLGMCPGCKQRITIPSA